MDEYYGYDGGETVYTGSGRSDKKQFVAIVLCLLLGSLGIHRFYLDKIGSGAVMLVLFALGMLTRVIWIGWGFLFIVYVWTIIDLIRILFNNLPDKRGRKLR